jgi:hypothetical protein
MVKFEDLEVGKEYNIIKKGSSLHPVTLYRNAKIIGKAKRIPVNYVNQVISNTVYDSIDFLAQHQIETVTNYNNEQLDYYFFQPHEDIKKELTNIIEKGVEQEINELSKKYEQEKQSVLARNEKYVNILLSALNNKGGR